MPEPFLGEIRYFSFDFAPKGWARCAGQILPINQNQALFSLLGTQYGGNGQTTFALPNLQGRACGHYGQGPGLSPRNIGEVTGSESVTLTAAQLPSHNHGVRTSASLGTAENPQGHYATPNADPRSRNLYATTGPAQIAVTTNTGGSQPHSNIQPYLVVNPCICLVGIFPSRS